METRLVLGERQKSPLSQICKRALEDCSEVWAAVAYITDERTLLEPCIKKGIPLLVWARYDDHVPVSPAVLNWFIGKSDTASCYLIPGHFHPKIYWWRGYGAYIGSANLSYSAWFQNFEAGTFFSEYDLEENGFRDELEDYFNAIREVSHPLTEEIVNEQRLLQKRWNEIDAELRKKRSDLQLEMLDSLAKEKSKRDNGKQKRKAFMQEWSKTLQILRDLGKKLALPENRPVWLHENVPGNLIADQFLHAYYYSVVRDGNRSQFREMHDKNRGRRSEALEAFLGEWVSSSSSFDGEAEQLHEWAPIIRDLSAPERIKSLDRDEFATLLSHVHAFRMVARQAGHKSLGFDEKLEKMTLEERCQLVSRNMFRRKNSSGESCAEVLYKVLWGGSVSDTPFRLYEYVYDRDKKVRQLGLSTLGELIGWAMPEDFAPRNDRTNKALYAFGYEVAVRSG